LILLREHWLSDVTSGDKDWNYCTVNPRLIVTTLPQLCQLKAFVTKHRLAKLIPRRHCCTSIERFVIGR
jgi:hypothetical protein